MATFEIKHPDVWKISDDRYENAMQFISIELNLVVLGCIEQGREDIIRDFIDEKALQYLEEVLPEKEKWIQVMSFVCGTAFAFAIKGGLSSERASAITTKYINNIEEVNDSKEFVQIQRNMYIHFANEVRDSKKIKTGNKLVDIAINYIENHVDTKIKVQQIADACASSLSSLQHSFSQHTGMTLTDYIRKMKIEKACFLLVYTDMSCTKIAEKLSYSSQSYFINQFFKEMKINPLDYRKRHQVIYK